MKISQDPNVSIVMPGCNAQCDFCFGQYNFAPVKDWMAQLVKNLAALPEDFWQISITGGEPLLSPLLPSLLMIIDRERWTKIVLTTNGTVFMDRPQGRDLLQRMEGVVDHVNISRHSMDYDENMEIFGIERMPNDFDTSLFMGKLNQIGIDVTFNCVLGASKSEQNEDWIRSYLQWARMMGAQAVSFRKKQIEGGNLDPTPSEEIFNLYGVVSKTSCAVCRSKTQIIDGINVIWKASVYDPGQGLADEVYEVIWQPSGQFTLDWEGRRALIAELLRTGALKMDIELETRGRPHSPREGKPKKLSKRKPKKLSKRKEVNCRPSLRC